VVGRGPDTTSARGGCVSNPEHLGTRTLPSSPDGQVARRIGLRFAMADIGSREMSKLIRGSNRFSQTGASISS
jgi:hypothetical protein